MGFPGKKVIWQVLSCFPFYHSPGTEPGAGALCQHIGCSHPTLDLVSSCLPHLWSGAWGRTPRYTPAAAEPLLALALAPAPLPLPHLGSRALCFPAAFLHACSQGWFHCLGSLWWLALGMQTRHVHRQTGNLFHLREGENAGCNNACLPDRHQSDM